MAWQHGIAKGAGIQCGTHTLRLLAVVSPRCVILEIDGGRHAKMLPCDLALGEAELTLIMTDPTRRSGEVIRALVEAPCHIKLTALPVEEVS